jgi:hypothetical protein
VRDLNVLFHNREKRGGDITRDLLWERMEDLLVEWDMIDVKPNKGNFT